MPLKSQVPSGALTQLANGGPIGTPVPAHTPNRAPGTGSDGTESSTLWMRIADVVPAKSMGATAPSPSVWKRPITQVAPADCWAGVGGQGYRGASISAGLPAL